MQLSEHFSLEELISSGVAARAGIDNHPSTAAYENLKMLANSLELVRALLGSPIHIDSGFRCVELNTKVGGEPNSAHMDGLAADIICPAFGSPIEICKKIAESGINFEHVTLEFNSWCHFAIPHKGLVGIRKLQTIDKAGRRPGLES